MVDPFYEVNELFFEALVGTDIEAAAEQSVEGIVEILLGFFDFASLVVGEAGLVFLFDARD